MLSSGCVRPPGCWRSGWFGLLLVCLAMGCGGEQEQGGSAPAPGPGSSGGAGGHAADASLPPVGLAVGQTAPEIAGQDIQGTPFKLSDYRGKVVVLDFWGDW